MGYKYMVPAALVQSNVDHRPQIYSTSSKYTVPAALVQSKVTMGHKNTVPAALVQR